MPKLGDPKHRLGVLKPRLADSALGFWQPGVWVPTLRLGVPKLRLGFLKPRLRVSKPRLGISKPRLGVPNPKYQWV